MFTEFIELNVGDVFRFNRARKHNLVVNKFEYEGETYYNYIEVGVKYPSMHIRNEKYICYADVYHNDHIYNGVVEVNGYIVRGLGGKVLKNPKPVKVKTPVEKTFKVETPAGKTAEVKVKFMPVDSSKLTDFQKFLKVQRSGVINMTDIVRGSRLAGISEEKYTDILFNYADYKSGKRV